MLNKLIFTCDIDGQRWSIPLIGWAREMIFFIRPQFRRKLWEQMVA